VSNEWGKERYEKTGDYIFRAFQKRLSRSPDQCIRYSYQGKPLWITLRKPTEIPNCQCGAKRVYEFSLMPPLLYHLKLKINELDFGVAAVYTCQQCCSKEGYVTEYIYVQSVE